MRVHTDNKKYTKTEDLFLVAECQLISVNVKMESENHQSVITDSCRSYQWMLKCSLKVSLTTC